MFNKEQVFISVFFILAISFGFTNKNYGQTIEQAQPDAFAKFLFSSDLYELAAEEYERLSYYNPENLGYLKRLLNCYSKLGKKDDLSARLNLADTQSAEIAEGYYDLLVQTGRIGELKSLFQKQQDLFSPLKQEEVKFKIAVGESSWSEAKALYDNNQLGRYEPIVVKIEDTKFKKPGLAATLSAILPGAGRVYAKDAKDGIISLLFVGSFGYQAYRRFSQKGTSSVGGWIYGGVALGFYVSNIYGSYQSAKFYNKKQNEKIHSFSMPLLLADN